MTTSSVLMTFFPRFFWWHSELFNVVSIHGQVSFQYFKSAPARLPTGESSFSPPSPLRLWSWTGGLILEIRSLLPSPAQSPIQLYCFGGSQTLPALSSRSTLKQLRRDQSRSRLRDRLLSKPGPHNAILPVSLLDIWGISQIFLVFLESPS